MFKEGRSTGTPHARLARLDYSNPLGAKRLLVTKTDGANASSAKRPSLTEIVCMISHTKINRDARVSRTAEALLQRGFRLHLICVENSKEPQIPLGLEKAHLHQIKDLQETTEDLSNLRARAGGSKSGRILKWLSPLLPRLLPTALTSYAVFYLRSLYSGLQIAPSIIHCHDLNVLPIGYILSRWYRGPLIYDSHEIFTEKVGLRFKWFWSRLEKFLVRRCQFVITTTEARADVFQKMYPGLPRPSVVHNYPSSFAGATRDIRALAGLPPDAFVALYQGGLQPHRGLEAIIESARYAREVFFVIQGDGPLFKRLQGLAQDSPNARLVPGTFYCQLREYTASADVGLQVLEGVSLNHTTTLSNKVFEYIHAGLPVIASDFCMLRQYVERYQFGMLVSPGDPTQIAQEVLHLYRNPVKRRRLSQKAIEASKVLNWENERNKLLALYDATSA